MNVWVICTNTFREAIRDRILYLLVVFAVLILITSKALGVVSLGEDLKVITDIGLMTISLFGALIVIFLGTGLIYKEIDKRTIYVILSRPVARWQFLLGKYFGLLLTTLLMQALMAAFFLAYLYIMSLLPRESTLMNETETLAYGPILVAVWLTLCEMILLTAVAIMFSAVSTPILSAVFTTVAYVTGHLADKIEALAEIVRFNAQTQQGSDVGYALLMMLYYIFPNLNVFNVRNEAAHGLYGHFPHGYPLWLMLYGLLQACVFLSLGVLAFRRRNF